MNEEPVNLVHGVRLLNEAFLDMGTNVDAASMKMNEFLHRLQALQADVDRFHLFTQNQYVIEEMDL